MTAMQMLTSKLSQATAEWVDLFEPRAPGDVLLFVVLTKKRVESAAFLGLGRKTIGTFKGLTQVGNCVV